MRDQHGVLRLSKAAAAYHPGRGVYRSSFMNARRLAATETNIAYRTADYERWQQMDFVVGIRVSLSNNHNCKGMPAGAFVDICDELSAPYGFSPSDKRGLYPKDFKFTGWHPHCRCIATPVLKTMDELAQDAQRIMAGDEPTEGSANQVTEPAPEFRQWVEANAQRITTAKSLPYFIKDNKTWVDSLLHPQPEVKDNLSQLSEALGIAAGKPMTHQEADYGRSNPHYTGKRDDPYSTNCQSCVVAYEARRRGLDVAAMPNYGDISSAAMQLARFGSAYIDPINGKRKLADVIAKPIVEQDKVTERITRHRSTPEMKLAALDEATKEQGRYQIGIYWKKSMGGGGHFFCAERTKDGALVFFDPQTGQSDGILTKYLRAASQKQGLDVLRVDNLDFDIKRDTRKCPWRGANRNSTMTRYMCENFRTFAYGKNESSVGIRAVGVSASARKHVIQL